jgi:hypothetical protein
MDPEYTYICMYVYIHIYEYVIWCSRLKDQRRVSVSMAVSLRVKKKGGALLEQLSDCRTLRKYSELWN